MSSEMERLDQPPKKVEFKRGEVINIEGFRFTVIQVCPPPHNTITLQLIGPA